MFTTIVSPEALRERLGDGKTVVVDCRHLLSDFTHGKRRYDESHIPGAFFVDVESDLAGPKTGKNGRHPMPDPEKFVELLRSLRVHDATQIVAYDDGADMFAPRFWYVCHWIGHDAVAILDGGFTEWTRLGYPVTTEVPQRRGGGTVRLRPHAEVLVDAAYVQEHHRDPSLYVLDARAADRFAGQNETIDPIAGHIPGSHNRWFKRNFAENGRLKSAQELKEEFAAHGDPKSVVHSCGSGVSSAVNMLAMEHAGLHGSRIYGGSWSEWIADPKHPVATGSA
ncbi:MAG TPA: sulfurtransferase [Verrucomicrobiae bacterium]|nr:sulfurtransferase [Verrucomicrobiae bacterium]